MVSHDTWENLLVYGGSVAIKCGAPASILSSLQSFKLSFDKFTATLCGFY